MNLVCSYHTILAILDSILLASDLVNTLYKTLHKVIGLHPPTMSLIGSLGISLIKPICSLPNDS